MNITPLRMAVLAGAASALLSLGTTTASAATYVSVRVGTPPPPHADYRPWGRPHPNAVWIAGHNEWRGGRWVWIGGYYDYPPRRGGHWVPSRYDHGYYYPGRWAY